MQKTIIDSDDYSAAGIETLFFPGGEPHAKVPFLGSDVVLYLKLRTWNDVGLAAAVVSAMAQQRIAHAAQAFIPYFPGARQDRSDGSAPLTVNMISKLFEAVGSICVFDAHSPVTLSMHDEISNFMPSDLPLPLADYDGIIAPDKGAIDRARDFSRAFTAMPAPVIECSKERDQRSGRLSHYVLPPLPTAGRYLVVDDICDGGGTFNLLAEAFERDPAAADSELELFVSHGIFSKGLDAIHSRYKRITTTDSWCQLPPSERLAVIPLLPNLLEKISV